MKLITVADAAGRVLEPEWLARAEPLHRQLRPQLPVDYALTLYGIIADGAEMVLLVEESTQQVLGLALFRCYRNTFNGIHFYVDDLVVDASRRSQGYGKCLLDHMSTLALQRGATVLTLDSGTHRGRAHAFYFREQFEIRCFNFEKKLQP
ncbi:GNAT family N-acetyltransferase [Leeia sp.]|uniref:GNAT family N-acetyltransferase n=1 Tax=Leeia sp. TaxID=2884678 RepID=UPI0035B1C0A7